MESCSIDVELSADCWLKEVIQSLLDKEDAIEMKSAFLKSRNEWLSSSMIWEGRGTW